jgi:predicted RNA methylase
MNPVYPFSAYEHSVMLGDHVRLDAYHQAIKNQIKPGMVVAEIGTGTGILSAYVASQTKNEIFAIEYRDTFAALAKQMVTSAGLTQVQVLQGKSFDVLLSPEPHALVTETIGAIGPEEHIVEICHDFKKRHPKLALFIPAKLRMYAEPIRSTRIHESEHLFLDYFSTASYGTFNYEAIRPDLLKTRSTHLLFDSLKNAESLGARTLLAEYILGETSTPEFSMDLDLGSIDDADGYHLYFEAELDKETILSTRFSEPETHWAHAYARRPEKMKKLKVSYLNVNEYIAVSWT